MSIETMTKLASYTVGVTSESSVTFSNIPQTYTDLYVVGSHRVTGTGANVSSYVTINGSLPTLNFAAITSDGGTVYPNNTVLYSSNSTSQTASTFTSTQFYFSDYTSGNYKKVGIENVQENNATGAGMRISGGVFQTTSPITQLSFSADSNWTQYTTFTLYGIRNINRSVPSLGWAYGGTIKADGTYIYHTFTGTGTFFANTTIKDIEYLVVAGAGGGGSFGGGGGAGGLRYQYLSSLNPGQYTVFVGAGGAGGISNSQGSSGTYSSFNNFSATGGGGAGGYVSDGLSGGSGGGGGTQGGANRAGGSGNAGGYSPVEGYAGGNGYGGGSPYGAGGGGGATAVGATSSGASGAGGAGSSAYSSWGSTTGTGQNISGTYWYAGGGGGASNSSYGAGGNGGGGSGGNTGTNGLANTGGGGGGANSTLLGGSGGSGIVIIRYKA